MQRMLCLIFLMSKPFRVFSAILLLFSLFTGCAGYDDGTSKLPLSFNGLRTTTKISNYHDIKFKYIEKQRYDYSCGTGALATLLKYYFGESVSEKQIIELILKDKSEKEIQTIIEQGFSLLDLKEVAEELGYIAGGYRLKPNQLKKLTGPVIVFIHPDGYKHFSIMKGVKGADVYLADPSAGNIRVPFESFNTYWDGITLVLGSNKTQFSPLSSLDITESDHSQPEILSARELVKIRTASPLMPSFKNLYY
jgi:uncharacterized protein